MSYTTGTAFLEALLETGVEYVFANLGSDHTSIVEAYAAGRRAGKPLPQLITAPHEFVAMTAAHGYGMVTGRAQAVIVHVECGTQSLAGAVHNAAKGRVPLFVFAGASPATQEGEARGSRNEFIQWLQDVFDQRGLVRGYMRYDNEIRVGANVKQLIHRAMQFAHSEPKGPVYMVGAREVMEQDIAPVTIDRAKWPAIAPAALPPDAPAGIATLLANAKRPLIVTSYAGRTPAAFDQLARLAQRLGIGVLESVPNQISFSHEHPLYQGSQWNEKRQNPALAAADVILVVDSDVPWIPQINRPSRDARIVHIDTDPLKQQMPLWYIGAEQVYRADAAVALGQINTYLDGAQLNESLVNERRGHYERRHAERAEMLRKAEQPTGDAITPEYLSACVGRAIGQDAIVLSEAVTNFHNVANHIRRTKQGTLMTSGGGSLGWNGGAAVGVKLAKPDAFVTAMTGDGTYMFSVPATVHWMSRRYRAPFLQVIFNNKGWRAPRYSAMGVHPEGLASQGDDIAVSFEPPPDYAGIAAAAGGAHPERITRADEVESAIARAVRAVREEGRSAVIDASV
jgi:acetolactate synthase I/II/III large subunit